jgi:hypothetical protein
VDDGLWPPWREIVAVVELVLRVRRRDDNIMDGMSSKKGACCGREGDGVRRVVRYRPLVDSHYTHTLERET